MDYNTITARYTALLSVVNSIADKLDTESEILYHMEIEREENDEEIEIQRDICNNLNNEYEKLGEVLDTLFNLRAALEQYNDACDFYADDLEKYGLYD